MNSSFSNRRCQLNRVDKFLLQPSSSSSSAVGPRRRQHRVSPSLSLCFISCSLWIQLMVFQIIQRMRSCVPRLRRVNKKKDHRTISSICTQSILLFRSFPTCLLRKVPSEFSRISCVLAPLAFQCFVQVDPRKHPQLDREAKPGPIQLEDIALNNPTKSHC